MTPLAQGLGGAAAAAVIVGGAVLSLRRHRAAARMQQCVLATAPGSATVAEDEFLLPKPVQRYFQFAGVRPAQVAPVIRMEQRGEFLLGKKWRSFHAEQIVNPDGPAFLWNASIRLLPGLSITVADSYCDGVGHIEAHLARVIPLARREDRLAIATGELHRYLAEAVWNPAALQPGHGIRWEPIDRDSARATLSAHGLSVSLDFLFDASGAMVQAYTPARFRDVNGTAVPTPWLCHYRDYARFNRLMVPQEGVVTWVGTDGAQDYCRLRIDRIEHLAHQGNLRRPMTGATQSITAG